MWDEDLIEGRDVPAVLASLAALRAVMRHPRGRALLAAKPELLSLGLSRTWGPIYRSFVIANPGEGNAHAVLDLKESVAETVALMVAVGGDVDRIMYATPATKRTLFKKARGQRRVLDRVAGLFTGHATPEGGQPPPPQGAPVGARGEQGRRNATADLGRHQGVAAAVEAANLAAADAAAASRSRLSLVARAKALKEAAAARDAAELSCAALLTDVIAQVQARGDAAAAAPDPEGAAADRAENAEMAALEEEPQVWVFAGLPDPSERREVKKPAARVHGKFLRYFLNAQHVGTVGTVTGNVYSDSDSAASPEEPLRPMVAVPPVRPEALAAALAFAEAVYPADCAARAAEIEAVAAEADDEVDERDARRLRKLAERARRKVEEAESAFIAQPQFEEIDLLRLFVGATQLECRRLMWLTGNRVARIYRETPATSDGATARRSRLAVDAQSPRWRTIAQLARGMLAQDAARRQEEVKAWEEKAGIVPPAKQRWLNAVNCMMGAVSLVGMAGAAAAGGASPAAGMLAAAAGPSAGLSVGVLAGPAAAAVLSSWPLIAGAFLFGAVGMPAPKARRQWEEKRRRRAEAAAAVSCGGAPPPLQAVSWWRAVAGGSSSRRSKRARMW